MLKKIIYSEEMKLIMGMMFYTTFEYQLCTSEHEFEVFRHGDGL